MNLNDLTVARYKAYDESDLLETGFLQSVAAALRNPEKRWESVLFESDFCQKLLRDLEEEFGKAPIPLLNRFYIMYGGAGGVHYWHIDIQEWGWGNTYNVWIPLYSLDPTVDGMEVITSRDVINSLNEGYSSLEELERFVFGEEIKEIENLRNSRYYVQFDSDMRYKLWDMEGVEKTYVPADEFTAQILNAHVFHSTSPTVTARIAWILKFTFEDVGFSQLRRNPSRRIAVEKFLRNYLYTNPIEHQRRVFRKLELESLAALHTTSVHPTREAELSSKRDTIRQLFSNYFAGVSSRDNVDRALRRVLSKLAAHEGGIIVSQSEFSD